MTDKSRNAHGNPDNGSTMYTDMAVTSTDASGPSDNPVDLQRHFYASLFDEDTRALAAVTTDGTIADWNRAAARLFGYPAKDIAGAPLSALFPADRPQEITRVLDVVYGGESLRDYITVMVHNDGRRLDTALTATPVRDCRNRVIGLTLTVRTMTPTTSHDTIPADMYTRYNGFLRNFKGIAFRRTLDGHTAIILGATKEITGYTDQELTNIDFDWNSIVHPDDLASKIEQDDLMRRTPFRGWECEYRIVGKDGDIRWVHENAQAMVDGKGIQDVIEGSLYDVTLRRRAEESLKISEEKYRLLFDNLYDAAFLSDHKTGMIVEMNKKCGTLFYAPRHELRTILDIPIADTDGTEYNAGFMQHINEHMSASYETEAVICGGDNDTFPVLVMAQAFTLGSRRLILWILHDLSLQKKMQEQAIMHQRQLVQADKLASLGILVSGVAHEINNPNQFIMLNIATLRSMLEDASPILHRYYEENGDYVIGGMMYSEANEQVRDIFDEITAGSMRIKHIVSELRDFASDRPFTEAAHIDMNAVVKSAVSLLRNMIQKSTSRFSLEYGEIPPLKGSFQRLEQVVINIIQNACQALPSPEKAITVSTAFNRPAQCVICTISDEGAGMTDAIKKHIFDPFFTTKRGSGGTGLGLSISSSIVLEHKGRLEFDSRPGEGTTATLILPVGYESHTTTENSHTRSKDT